MEGELVAARGRLAGVAAGGGADGDADRAGAGGRGGDVHLLAGVRAGLVGAGEPVVLVEAEGGVAARVDVVGEGGDGLLARVVHLRPHRHDRPALDEERQGVERRLVVVQPARAGVRLPGPVVRPGPGGEVDAVADGGVGDDGRDEEGVASHELAAGEVAAGHRVVRVLQDQGAGARHAALVGGAAHGVEVRHQPHLELEVLAVDGEVRLGEAPGLLVLIAGGRVGRAPARHGHEGGGEGLPLEVAGVRLGAAAEDAVDVAGGVVEAGQAGAGDGGDVPAHVVPGAVGVAGPDDGVALGAGPAVDGPDVAAGVGVLLDAVDGLLDAGEGALVAAADPGDVRLHAAGAGDADLVGDGAEAGGGPQSGLEALGLQGVDGGFERGGVAAAVAVVGQEPARGHVGCAGVGGVADHVGGGLVAQAVVVALVVGVGGVETVGIAELEAPHRRHEGLSADVGVRVEYGLERIAGEVPGVEALLVVGEGGGGVETVRTRGPGVAHDAVAVGGHVEGGGAGVVVLAPFVVDGDGDGLVAQRPFAEAQAGPVELLVGAAGQVLGGLGGRPGGGPGLLPDQGGVVGAVDGELQGCFVDADVQGSGGDPVVRARVGEGGVDGAEVGGRGEVGAGRVVGERAVG